MHLFFYNPRWKILFLLSILFCVSLAGAYTIPSDEKVIISSQAGNFIVSVTDKQNIYYTTTDNWLIWEKNNGCSVDHIALSGNGNYIAASCTNGKLFYYDSKGNLRWSDSVPESIRSLRVSSGGESVRVTLTSDNIFTYSRNGERSYSAVTKLPTTLVTEITVTPTVTQTPVKTGGSTIGLLELRELYLILLLVIIIGWCIYFKQKSRSYIELGSHAVPITPASCTIFAESLPEGAAIQINSNFVGYAPITIPNLLPGQYSLSAHMEGYTLDVKKLSLAPGQAFHYQPVLIQKPFWINPSTLGTSPSSPRPSSHVPVLAICLSLLGLLFIGDIISTEYILVHGGIELNPYMIPFVSDPLLHVGVKLVAFCIIAFVAVYANRKVPHAGSILIIAVVSMYLIVLAANLMMIFRVSVPSV
jgi:hypothetical protein